MGQKPMSCRIAAAVLAIVFLSAVAARETAIEFRHAGQGQLAAVVGSSAVQAARRMLPDPQAVAVATSATVSGSPSQLGLQATAKNPGFQAFSGMASSASTTGTTSSQVGRANSPAGSTSSSSTGSSTQGGLVRQQLGLAGDLRLYLEEVFRNAPEALLKIGQAGQQDDQEGEPAGGF
jgi:hypothetical protein